MFFLMERACTPCDLVPGGAPSSELSGILHWESCNKINVYVHSLKWMYVATEIEINIRLKKQQLSFTKVLLCKLVVGPSTFGFKVSVSPELVRPMPTRAGHWSRWKGCNRLSHLMLCNVSLYSRTKPDFDLLPFLLLRVVLQKVFWNKWDFFFFITSKSLHVSLFHWRVLTAYFVSNFKGTVCKFMSSSAHILDCPALIRSPSFSQACRVTTLVFAHHKRRYLPTSVSDFFEVPHKCTGSKTYLFASRKTASIAMSWHW